MKNVLELESCIGLLNKKMNLKSVRAFFKLKTLLFIGNIQLEYILDTIHNRKNKQELTKNLPCTAIYGEKKLIILKAIKGINTG